MGGRLTSSYFLPHCEFFVELFEVALEPVVLVLGLNGGHVARASVVGIVLLAVVPGVVFDTLLLIGSQMGGLIRRLVVH